MYVYCIVRRETLFGRNKSGMSGKWEEGKLFFRQQEWKKEGKKKTRSSVSEEEESTAKERKITISKFVITTGLGQNYK